MNRRSFLLGLARVPVVGIGAVASTPTVVMGMDAGGPDICRAYVLVNKRDGMSPLAYWDEVHHFGRSYPTLNTFEVLDRHIRREMFLKIETTPSQ